MEIIVICMVICYHGTTHYRYTGTATSSVNRYLAIGLRIPRDSYLIIVSTICTISTIIVVYTVMEVIIIVVSTVSTKS